MTELTEGQAKALGGRWMALPDFKWEPGMMARYGKSHGIVCWVQLDTLHISGDGGIVGPFATDEVWPDLRHAGTVGAAWLQTQAALNLAWPFTLTHEAPGWRLEAPLFDVSASSLAEVLVATMEAAHG